MVAWRVTNGYRYVCVIPRSIGFNAVFALPFGPHMHFPLVLITQPSTVHNPRRLVTLTDIGDMLGSYRVDGAPLPACLTEYSQNLQP
jgi:hypothetical protein